MTQSNRDASILSHIIVYCDEIIDAIKDHNLTLDILQTDSVFRNGLSMGILQIGELVGGLSEGFKKTHSSIPWREIKRMRDKAAHHYNLFDTEMVWETAINDIPVLRSYCQGILTNLNVQNGD